MALDRPPIRQIIKDAVEELGEFDKIKNIKGIEEFILKPPELCNLKKDMNYLNLKKKLD